MRTSAALLWDNMRQPWCLLLVCMMALPLIACCVARSSSETASASSLPAFMDVDVTLQLESL
jgi:hypothetical protein